MSAIKTIIYALRSFPLSFEKGCLVNGVFDLELSDVMTPDNMDVVASSYQSAQKFKDRHYEVFSSIPDKKYDICVVLLPKQKDQSLYDVAMAIEHVSDNGSVVLCAAKDAGGERLKKIAEAMGLDIIQTLSKFHCKYLVARKTQPMRDDVISSCIKAGELQINDHGYHVKPGVFGWNKVDAGSTLLSKHIPDTLSGRGADFGCGYGYLTDMVFKGCPKVAHMTCIDSDRYAVQSCELNMKDRHSERSYDVVWGDLTQGCPEKSLNFIVMNPPFHDGKGQDTGIAKQMIQQAHGALGKYGVLYIVANVHLPYEDTLNELFFEVTVLGHGGGFKIFKALK